MDQPRIVYTTFPDEEVARTIARALVEERLAACVNLIPGMRSVYRWEEAIEEAGEIVGIVKTRAQLIDRVEACIKELHPYDTPVIVHLAVTGTDKATFDWLMEQTGGV
ncbi:MAG TPA: divalent-cation tolerance protein CutA [Saliniramus sp.]|nr:divalent-cation tolerance protein CutA [Saliniramus sp.]